MIYTGIKDRNYFPSSIIIYLPFIFITVLLLLFQNAYVLYYLAIVGHSLSIFTLVISLGIFVFFK